MVNLKNENIDVAITCTDIVKTRYFFEKILCQQFRKGENKN